MQYLTEGLNILRLYYQRLNDVLQVATAEILVRIFEYEKVTEEINIIPPSPNDSEPS